MKILPNPFRGTGLETSELTDVPFPSTAGDRPASLLLRCPRAGKTPLIQSPELAEICGVGSVLIKDERDRMGLGSFKALGAAYVIAHDAESGKARGATYVTASAGNHGLSVAAGAAAFGANAVVFVSIHVPEPFADRLRQLGAEVVRSGDTYEASMAAAAAHSENEGAILLSDSSWPGYVDRPLVLMEGYLVLMDEVFGQIEKAPSHIFLQAGVGGLAGAAAAAARAHWGDAPVVIVVEPEAAPAIAASISAGKPVFAPGPVSSMGRLDCKEPSLIALKGLARDCDFCATITEDEGAAGSAKCENLGMPTTPSGAAGISAVLAASGLQGEIGLDSGSRVLTILSEGPEA
ncbi:MAG: pyridoxal-phosphate dependent enzyme [Boseongicola sp.]